MLSNLNFIRRTAKRKAAKVQNPPSHQKTPSASSSIVSPLVFNINEEAISFSGSHSPLLAKLSLSEPTDDWFLQRRSRSPESSLDSKGLTQVTRVDTFTAPEDTRCHTPLRGSTRKKSIPAPILIPDAEKRIPNVRIGPSALAGADESQQKAGGGVPPSSPSGSDLSAISGTTLARALISSTFVLPSNERRNSRHRSVVRQDSATLPRRESVFQLPESGRSSPIPPVPPVPTTLVTVPSHANYAIKSGSSTESEYPLSDAYITSPEVVIHSELLRRNSRTQGTHSHTAFTSLPLAISDIAPKQKTVLLPAPPRHIKNAVFDGPKTAVELPLPFHPPGITQHSSQEGLLALSSEDHSLDEFDFVPPEPLVAIASPGSDSSTSFTSPVRRRSDTKRKRRVGGTNFVRNGAFNTSESALALQQDQSIPSATVSDNDYGELRNYDLTVSPGSSSSSNVQSGGSAGYQTFPETPMIFSPLWSPAYALLSKSDTQMLRKLPLTPKSAVLGSSKRLLSGMRPVRRPVDNSSSVSHPAQLSALLPRQEKPKPNLAPSVLVTDGDGVSDERDPSSTTESQNPANLRVTARPHPLARISASGSCFPEEDALWALARHSSSSLPSFVIGDDGAPSDSMPVPVAVSSGQSPTSHSFPEQTSGSPLNSPALVGSAAATSSSAPPLQVPSSSSTVVSELKASKLPLSATSFHGEPVPPSPVLSNRPLLTSRPPMPNNASSGVSDMSISPSFFPPPPYHTVMSERMPFHLSSNSTPSLSSSPRSESSYRRGRQASTGSTQSRLRMRPAAPLGPRKPSGVGRRNLSISSAGSGDPSSYSGPWPKLQEAASKPLPKFQIPPQKWRGLTLEAAQWTFTSTQLQEVVSCAIQQSSEGSCIRLLRLDVLEGEITDEMHRLELQHTDIKAQYKALVRKRWLLMARLANQIENGETNEATNSMEALAELSSTLDHVADRMHDVVIQMSQLKSLRDVHNASALALAVRKINGVFVRQMAEKERLQGHIDTLKAERDEAWKHAEDIARDYDMLNDRVSETVRADGDAQTKSSINTAVAATSLGVANRRSTRITAVRSSIRMSRVNFQSRSRHHPGYRSPSNATRTRPSSLSFDDPLPPLPRLAVNSTDGPGALSTKSLDSAYSCDSGTSEALALALAQHEVYEMLGMSVPPSQASSTPFSAVRRRTISSPGEAASTRTRRRMTLSLASQSLTKSRTATIRSSGVPRPRIVSEVFQTHTLARSHSRASAGVYART